MSYLLLSYHHGLLPLALRLRLEGQAVEHLPWRGRYERAWEGAIDTVLKGEAKRDAETLAPVIELAREGGLTVLYDHPRWATLFGMAPKRYGVAGMPSDEPQPIRACGWWTGETLVAPHLLVVELGAYPGGMGARVEGGATLIQAHTDLVQRVWASRLDELKASEHRGLVQMHLDPKTLAPLWWEGGWKGLHTHAFLAAQNEPLHRLLEHGEYRMNNLFSVVVPVTMPPWPVHSNATSQEVEVGGPREALGCAFWHDARMQGEKLYVAGLDGYVAVSRGSGNSLLLARQRALAVAQAIELPEKQVRVDVGANVEGLLAALEASGNG